MKTLSSLHATEQFSKGMTASEQHVISYKTGHVLSVT